MTNREAAIKIIRRLRSEGHQALLAGGCVRDMLLNRQAKDYDVATSAVPDQVIALFKRTIKVGAQFGVVMVMIDEHQIEVATFRTESGYADGRHPDNVEFAGAKEDASRRDFTINGMFYDPVEKQLIDFVGGREDLARGILRTIGPAEQRFAEDYLRMLRSVRFSIRFSFPMDEQTWQGVCTYAGRIVDISGERIAVELEGILTHPNRVQGARLLYDSGLAEAIFGPFADHQKERALAVLDNLPDRTTTPLALAGLFASEDVAAAMARVERLRFSNADLRHLRFLLEHRDVLIDADMPLSMLKKLLAQPYFWDLYHFEKAICNATARSTTSLNRLRRRAEDLAGSDIRPKPLLNGHELIALGVVPGPMVGLVAEQMYIRQLEEQLSTPEQARKWVDEWLKSHARRE